MKPARICGGHIGRTQNADFLKKCYAFLSRDDDNPRNLCRVMESYISGGGTEFPG